MSFTTHAEHFLQRIDRLDTQHAELALGLYRDPDLLSFVLKRADLPPGEERVALALAEGSDGPHVIVTRDGKFVTCLGRGMRPHVGQAVIARHKLDQLSTKIDALRQIMHEAQGGGSRACKALMTRALQAGNTLTQEHFDDLVAWAPLVGHLYLDGMLRSMEKQLRVFGALLRVKNVRKAPERLVHGYWAALWGSLHMATLVGQEPRFLQALLETADEQRENADDHRWALLLPLWQTHLLGWGLRAAWLAARLPKAFLRPLKSTYDDAKEPSKICAVGCTLVAIGHRHKRLRAEISKALDRTDPSAAPSDRDLPAVLGRLLAGSYGEGIPEELHDISQRSVGDLVERYVREIEPEVKAEHLKAAPTSVKLAWMLTLATPVLQGTMSDFDRALMHLPVVSRMEARDFYVPRDYQLLLPFGGYHREIAMVFLEPRLASAASARPLPVRAEARPGRNEPCSCGSGKKYKRCCGAGAG